MQQWPQQAPLLHGSVAGVGQRDAESSSGSLTQEQVLAEVRKQVEVAMQAHTREMVSLREENENLRAIVTQSERANPRPPTTMPFLRGGNPARTPGEGDRRDGAQGDGLVGLPRGLHGEGGRNNVMVTTDQNMNVGVIQLLNEEVGLDNQASVGAAQEPTRPGDVRSSVTTAPSATPHPLGPTSTQGPSTDPFDMLAKGMAQLQSAMAASMTSKSSEPEQVKPGISELPRLPELSETSCIDIGDWIHALQCPMGDLSNSSAAWWQEVLLCLDRFYQAYLRSSNLTKLSLRPESFASAVVKEDKWSRVDKRATSMLLASLPESVRTEILASRLTGALQVLGRVMVLYRPGSTAERQQILKALELPAPATTAAEAVDGLRRWSRWLRRASDVGLQSPDPSILLRGLDNMVRRVLQENSEILFRINMMRYNLEVDVKPTQKSVEDLHQALLSEFEQVAFRGRAKAAPAPSIKSMSATGASTSAGNGNAEGGGDASPQRGKSTPCKFFLSDQGCRRGAACKYSHDVDKKQRQGRCWTCGSKQHMSKSCPTKEKPQGGKSPNKGNKSEQSTGTPTIAAMAPESSHPTPPTTTSPTAVQVGSGAASSTATNPMEATGQQAATSHGEDDLRHLIKEANTMLKEMRQLRMLTMEDVNAQASALGMELETGKSGLLDSGASHAFRTGSPEEIGSANRVRVQLATGDYVTLAQNRGGTLLATKSTDQDMTCPIVPLGSLVQDLNCELSWGRRRGLEIVHPVHGVIRPKVIGQCPLVGEAQALQLIKELEDKRVQELQRSNLMMQRTLWTWDHDLTWSRHLAMFLDQGDRVHQLKALEAEDSPFCSLPASLKGAIAEDVDLSDKAGWKYLKAVPVSRRVRKRLMTTPWVVNMFSGPANGSIQFKSLEDGAVLVEMDIVRSKAFDMRKHAGAYRALLWAAVTGRVKGFMASPPMRTSVDEELVAKAMWCSLVAKAARAHYLESPAFVMFEGSKLMDYLRFRPEGLNPTGVQQAWPKFMEVMCLDYQYGAVATNLDYEADALILILIMQIIGLLSLVLMWSLGSAMKYQKGVHAAMKYQKGVHTAMKYQKGVHAAMKYQKGVHTAVKYQKGVHTAMKYQKGVHTAMKYQKGVHTAMKYQKGVHTAVKYQKGVHTAMKYQKGVHTAVKYQKGVHTAVKYQKGVHTAMKYQKGVHTAVKYQKGVHTAMKYQKGVHTAVKYQKGVHTAVKYQKGVHTAMKYQKGVHTVVKYQKGALSMLKVVYDTGAGAGPLHAWSDGELLDDQEERAISPEEERRLPKGMTDEEFKKVFTEVDGIVGYQVMYLSSPLRSRTTKDVLSAVQDLYLRLRSLGYPVAFQLYHNPKREEYDPNDPVEEYARAVLKEGTVERDFVESLARLLPQDGGKPKRFGEEENEVVWATGAFVHGGIVGVLNNTKKYPRATKVFLDYLKQQCPGFKCNSLAVFKGISAEPHRDAHNVGLNAVVPISDFQGCDVVVKRGDQEVVPKVSEGPQLFDPHEEHYTTPCTEGTSLMLVGYSIRDSAKLKVEAIDLLEELGFEWDPHRSREDGDQLGGSRVPMMKVEVKPDVKEGLRKKGQGDLDYVSHDLDLAIQDMEERAARLRDLLEEEEIMVEQAHRLGRNFREELGDAREYVCRYLDGVHKQLMQLQQLREGIFLKAARSTEEELNAIDYEKLLDELEGDLDVIYTVPLEQVKRVLQRWTEAIKREVTSLFGSGTLVKVPYQKAKAMERDGTLKIVPAKCVFTLKPPPSKGSKYKRKCRMVICGNYITKDDAGEQMSLYASGTSSDVLRLALTVASSRTWVAAIADVTSAFLLAEWPAEMPRYALVPPKVIRDAVEYDTDLWMVQRPLYGLRESPVIWSEFRNAKLRELKVLVRGRHLGLKQLQSESELWLLRDEQTQELYGILVVYVDDLMYLAENDVVIQLHNQIKALWPTSDLE
eukprot:s729_g8.t2